MTRMPLMNDEMGFIFWVLRYAPCSMRYAMFYVTLLDHSW